MFKGLVQPAELSVDKFIQKIASAESELEKIARLLDAERELLFVLLCRSNKVDKISEQCHISFQKH